MEATGYISFLELESGSDTARLGAGPAQSVLARSASNPFLRLCFAEPSPEHVRVRARCGRTTVDPLGDVEETDPMLRLGAWAGVLPLLKEVARMFESTPSTLWADLEPGIECRVWLECAFNPPRIKRINEQLARIAFDGASELGAVVAIELVGSKTELESLIDLMRTFGKPAS